MKTINSNNDVMNEAVSMMTTVPQIMATRIWMYADTNPSNFANQQQEYKLMFEEKQQAFVESVQNVHQQMFNANTSLMTEAMKGWQGLFSRQPYPFRALNQQIEKEAINIMNKGISPYSSRVKANNERLHGQ